MGRLGDYLANLVDHIGPFVIALFAALCIVFLEIFSSAHPFQGPRGGRVTVLALSVLVGVHLYLKFFPLVLILSLVAGIVGLAFWIGSGA